LPTGAVFSTPVSSEFNAFIWMLEGEATVAADGRRAAKAQIAILGPGDSLTVTDAQPGTRMVMAGKPYGETPIYNGPYVD
jgi:redox-sensitive bicupin YhaK (pirin superfamily)